MNILNSRIKNRDKNLNKRRSLHIMRQKYRKKLSKKRKKNNLNSQSPSNKFISKKKSLNKLRKLISLLNIRNSNQKFLKKSGESGCTAMEVQWE